MIRELSAKWKTILIGIGAYVGGLLIVQFIVPAMAGADAIRPSVSVYILGLFQAIPAALTAASLVLIYRSVRIINWAHFALGALSAQFFYELYLGKGLLPYGAALAIGLITGPLMGIIVGVIFATLFYRHPRLVLTVGTILMTGLIVFVQSQIDSGFHKAGERRAFPPVIGPWPDSSLNVGGTPLRFAHLVSFVLLAGLSIGLVVFFRRTRLGTAVRASAENSDRASLLGINVKLLQVMVWALVGFISSVGAIAVLPVKPITNAAATQFNFVDMLLPLSAAVVARMSSMPIAFFTGLGLMLAKMAIQFAAPDIASLSDIGLFAIIMAGLLVQKRRIVSRADEGTSWRAVKEVRPTPRELLALPVIARTRRAIILVLAAVVLGLPWIVGRGTTDVFTEVWIGSIIAISLVVLTGWTGQISLGQFALATVGAFVGGNLTAKLGVPFWFAVPMAGVAGALFAILIGIPALRIRGLFLAVTTFSVAAVMPLFVFDDTFLLKWVPDAVARPKLFFLDFGDNRSNYYLMLIVFVAITAMVQALRRSRAGRVLIALRDNEAGAQSFGVDIVRTRLTAFAMSGFIAAVGGALFVHTTRGMDPGTYAAPVISIFYFILVVIGGVSSVVGAVLGFAYFRLTFEYFGFEIAGLLFGVLGLMSLMFIPGGLTQIVFGARDAVLRVVAMRQHIVVPSLFADYSPEAWEKRLTPLSPALQTQGLAALRPDQRYALPTNVFNKPPAEILIGPPAWES